MASRTRKRWCASDVLMQLTLTLSSLCAGYCADIGTTTTTMTATITATMAPTEGPRECIGGNQTVQSKGEVKLAVIAPGDPHHEQSLPRVLPAVLLAVRYVSSPKGPLCGWNIKVDHRDSQCSSTYGALAAFEFYINNTAGCIMRSRISHTTFISIFFLHI